MRLLIILLLVGGLATLPFVYLKQPWAVRIWKRVRLVVVIYVLVILIAAVVRLAVNWEDIYG
jgi:hypothetical protein